MWGEGHVLGQIEENVVRGRGFVFVDVQRAARDVPALNGGFECFFIDESASCAVHHQRALVHEGKALGIDDLAGVVGEGNVQGDYICAGQSCLGRLGQLDLELVRPGLGQKGVESDDLHVESLRTLGELGPDAAHSDHRETFVVELDPRVGLAGGLEVPFQDFSVGRSDVAGGGEHQGEGVLGS